MCFLFFFAFSNSLTNSKACLEGLAFGFSFLNKMTLFALLKFRAFFQITAKDRSPTRPMAAMINCKIVIIDLNDNYPQFLQKEYSASFYEDAAIGTKLVKVEATDRDSSLFGKVKYTSINGPIAKKLVSLRQAVELF